ncbi:hypothetical protein Tco_1295934 [Tanacetum coccineum]
MLTQELLKSYGCKNGKSSNVNKETKEAILQVVPFTIGKLPVTYLGVPLVNMEYIKNSPFKKNIWTIVKKLVFAATTYFLWQERNIRLFQKVKRTEEELGKVIEEAIKIKLSGLRVTESSSVRELYVGIPIGTEVLLRLDDASYNNLCGSGCEHRQGVCMMEM